MKKKIKRTAFGKNIDLEVFWQLNDICNFRCKYCFCGDEKLAKEHPSVGKYSTDEIAESFNATGKIWQIHMSGGEPFLYPDFVGLCKKLTEKHYISINTNCSTSNMFKFADDIDPKKVVFINAGLHLDQRLKKDSIDSFVQRIIYFQEKGFNIDAGYLAYPGLLNRMEEDIKNIRKKGVKLVNAKVFRGYYEGKRYPQAFTQKERALIKENTLDQREVKIIDKKFNFFNKACSAGKTYMRMNPAGNLYRCSSSFNCYGNLFEGNYHFDDKPRPCPLTDCACPYEGLKYIEGGKASFVDTAKEVCKEIRWLPERGFTLTKVKRYLAKRIGIGHRAER